MRALAVTLLLLAEWPALAESDRTTTGLSLETGSDLALLLNREVTPRLSVPPEEVNAYARLLRIALLDASIRLTSAQYVLVVDRSHHVQALLVFWADGENRLLFIGASPVSTGRPGAYEHFLTPLGVFTHGIEHLDFRAEGTRNEFGVRGYGVKGMRVFDFGWVVGSARGVVAA
jgi:hypothetical protein